MSTEAIERKRRSEAILRFEGVPYIDHLPVIETESEANFRSKEQVAERAMALCIVAVKGEGLEQDEVERIVSEYSLADSFTSKEKEFINEPNPSHRDRVQFSWRYECYWVMLWALGFIESLDRPDTICDVPRAVSILVDLGRDEFVKRARLRSKSEILDAADLIYRYSWAAVEARITESEPPAGLDSGIVVERHYALNWLIGYMDQEWDDVSTDT